MQFTMSVTDFRRQLNNVILFTDKDGMHPVLNSVQIRLSEGVVTFTATNRYVLGSETVTPKSHEGSGSFLLSRDDAVRLVKMLPKRVYKYGENPTVTLTVEDEEKLRFEYATDGVSLMFQSVEGEFPKWDGLIPAKGDMDGVALMGFNASYLAIFAKMDVDDKHAPLRFTFTTSTRPARIDYGQTFVGLLMPVRIAA